ncbi:hypothetical protein AX768_09155 [Burkholderia sp. PAMC 28687]|uniref:structural cement protein Gp24 n=1 Tax=Burkholderia sp. PAMC 28687 TaxID=1795874 RepID=UPI0007806288|nr:hypothetical protein [Burkholderia sp. PAMC 28687]AMM14236.1 hypothetical protein AX768_09155 [Burkholderia sp. PAMC 28687]
MPFQTAIQQQPEIGVPGDRASMNPISVIARQVGTGGLAVARFVWESADSTVLNTGTGLPLGFAIRDQVGIILTYLQEAGMTLPAGWAVQVAQRGEWFATSANASTLGQKVFATLADGTLQFGAKGATVTGAIETPFAVERGGAANSVIKISTWSNYA